jgi:hypothetical protein
MHHAGDECFYAVKTGHGQTGMLLFGRSSVLMYVRHEHGFVCSSIADIFQQW